MKSLNISSSELDAAKDRLDYLKSRALPKAIDRISAARAYESYENAEYDMARQEREGIQVEIEELEARLKEANG